MADKIEGRFVVTAVTRQAASSPSEAYGKVLLDAAYNDGRGNEDWSKWTPSGKLEMTLTQPGAIDFYNDRVGKVIRVVMDDVPEV